MSHKHDPSPQFQAAAVAGRLAAAGLVEGAPLLRAIRRAAFRAAPDQDRRGLAMRLAHRFGDAHEAALLARAGAARRIAFALAPLLAARAPAAALLQAAEAADPAAALAPAERRAEVEAAIRRALARRRR